MNVLQTPSGPATRAAKSDDPTEEEIARLCAEIRAGWSEAERVKRLRVDWRGAEPVTPVVEWWGDAIDSVGDSGQ